MALGRPCEFTEQLGDSICTLVANGSNLNKICASEYLPSRDTIYEWLKKFPTFSDKYARAREIRADHRFDKIDDIVFDMRAGVIDSQMARVEIDAIKWQAGKESPGKYGDRVQTDHGVQPGNEIRLTIRRTDQPNEQPE